MLPPQIVKTKQNLDAVINLLTAGPEIPDNLMPGFHVCVSKQNARLVIYPQLVADEDVEPLLTFCESFLDAWSFEEEKVDDEINYTWGKSVGDNITVRVLFAPRKPNA